MDPRNTIPVYQTHIDYTAANASHSFDSNDAETLHSGGERSKSDPELTRKMIMPRHMEEHIFGKKAAIAPKKMKLSEKEQPGPDCVATTSRNRVTTFLQQQQCPSFVLKCNMFKPPVAREAPIRRSDQELLEDHHPLKRPVKALLKHSSGHPSVFLSNHPVPDHTAIRPLAAQLFPRPPPIATPPRSSSVTSPDQEESDANKGFERFLSLLNSGVNIELLSKIVNDDREDLNSEDGSVNVKPDDVDAARGEGKGESAGTSQEVSPVPQRRPMDDFPLEQSRDDTLRATWDQVISIDGQLVRPGIERCFPHFASIRQRLYRVSRDTQTGEEITQLLVPKSRRKMIFQAAHFNPMADHMGYNKTLNRVMAHFYWPCIRADVRRWCAACRDCQQVDSAASRAPLQPLPLMEVPFERIGMDLVGPFDPSTQGYRFALVLVDCATRYPEAVPLHSISAKSVAQALFQVISRVGIPKEILTDQETSFMSHTLKELYGLLGIKSIRTSVCHLQTDGLVERLNTILKSIIRKFVHKDKPNWHKWLDSLLFAVREVPQSSTGFSPFELLFVRKPRGVLDLVKESWEEGPSPSKKEIQYVMDLRAKLHTLGHLSHNNLLQAQKRQQSLYNRGTQLRQFLPGEKVFVLLPTSSSKLLAEWQGPFVVSRKVGDLDYEVRRCGRGLATQIYHINLLKRWREAEPISMVTAIAESKELGPEVPPSPQPFPLRCDHLTPLQRADVATLPQRFADVFSPLPSRTNLTQHHIEASPGVTVRSLPYRLPEHKHKVVGEELKGVLDFPIGSENHVCNNYTLIPEGTERSTYEQSSCETNSLSDDDKNRKDRQKCSLSLRDRSKSPPTIENKKEKEKAAEVDGRCELLQNILNTLGLNLETEELSKLTERTEERLYGKRKERSPVVTSIVEHDSTSSSHSPSRMQISNSRNFMDHHRERSFSECSDSRKSREELSLFSYQDAAPVQRIAGNNQDLQTFDETHHAHSSQEYNTVSGYSFPEHSQFNASFNGDNSSCWTHAHGSSSMFSLPYSLYTDHSHPSIASADSELRHYIYNSHEHVYNNPDLSLSECQFGSKTGPGCLQTVKLSRHCGKLKAKKKKKNKKKIQLSRRSSGRILKPIKLTSDLPKMMESPHDTKHQEVDHPRKGKQPPTEEEIKQNWKKKLEEFNQKNKSHTSPKS
ncbi:uncharacterized protein LOC133633904 [Entelurus aequoreus]|uniref:uncharacterized protein LOC133633904 n=1 Tax=Entelurus aequoreus TaxID=161455 RepID=UPI002B1E664B|nr:uncharacterized protein LOC133633904 [Entelurus aequoreus]XP_061882688.1 uncharacterized protein LOC133633904 [Entelurus aequoreus]XP_061882689.1 uncharacterized protein LOC133633904 [Entelurus aequoreus]